MRKKLVAEHRRMMEEYIGRSLKDTELVHHVNGDHGDNRMENLQLCTSWAEHRKIHGYSYQHARMMNLFRKMD